MAVSNRAKIALVALVVIGLLVVLVPLVLQAGFGVIALPPL